MILSLHLLLTLISGMALKMYRIEKSNDEIEQLFFDWMLVSMTVVNEIVQPYNTNKKQNNLSVMRKTLNILLINHAEKLGVKICFNEKVHKIDLDQRKIEFSSGSVQGGQVFGCEAVGGATLEPFPKDYMELSFTDDAPFNKDYLHIWPRGNEMIMALPNRNQGFTVIWFGDSEVDPDFSINFSRVNETLSHGQDLTPKQVTFSES
jgi:kynurenine 3-monooxygenase